MTYAVDLLIPLGPAETGLTLLATIKTMAGAAFASGVSGWTEDPAGSGDYYGTYSAFADGVSYRVQWFSGATLKSATVVSPADARISVDSAAIATLTAYVDTEVAAIKAKTDLIGTGLIVATAPVASTGDITLIRGDDYANADGRALEWTNATGTWPDLTGATITFTARLWDGTLTKAGSVIVPTGAGQKVRVELTKVNTAIALGTYLYDIQATLLTNLRVITLVQGTLVVTGDQTLT